MTGNLLKAKLSEQLDMRDRRCPRGHAVKFGKSPGGMLVCVCPGCIEQTGVIYRGHGLNRQDAYLRFLLAIANW